MRRSGLICLIIAAALGLARTGSAASIGVTATETGPLTYDVTVNTDTSLFALNFLVADDASFNFVCDADMGIPCSGNATLASPFAISTGDLVGRAGGLVIVVQGGFGFDNIGPTNTDLLLGVLTTTSPITADHLSNAGLLAMFGDVGLTAYPETIPIDPGDVSFGCNAVDGIPCSGQGPAFDPATLLVRVADNSQGNPVAETREPGPSDPQQTVPFSPPEPIDTRSRAPGVAILFTTTGTLADYQLHNSAGQSITTAFAPVGSHSAAVPEASALLLIGLSITGLAILRPWRANA
jgi:hypothetical protein